MVYKYMKVTMLEATWQRGKFSEEVQILFLIFQVLQVSYSHKNLTKCREYLRQVTSGLSANRFISIESLFIYVYGTTSETIPQLMPTPIEPPKKKNPRVMFRLYVA